VTYYKYNIDTKEHVEKLMLNFFAVKNGNDIGDVFELDGEKYKLMASGIHDLEVKHMKYGGLATYEIYHHEPSKKLVIMMTEADFPCFAGVKLFAKLLGFHATMYGSIPCIEIEHCLYCPNTLPSVVISGGYPIGDPHVKQE